MEPNIDAGENVGPPPLDGRSQNGMWAERLAAIPDGEWRRWPVNSASAVTGIKRRHPGYEAVTRKIDGQVYLYVRRVTQ